MLLPRAVIFANGEVRDERALRAVLDVNDTVVCADGGWHHARRLGLLPHLVVGDLDSVSADDVEDMRSAGVEIQRHPVDKDETDLELALSAVVALGFTRILILAALGGRLDQTLGNIYLLSREDLAGLDVRLDDGQEEVLIIRAKALVSGRAGDTLSLLPLTPRVEGVVTSGLLYPLWEETLFLEHTRGISNVMLGTEAALQIRNGLLLCIHTRQPQPKE
jgi:thiamine pyrophosphokinase